jgi:hypothetical protein
MPLKEARNKAASLLNINPDETSPSVIDTIRRYSEDHLAVNTRLATALVFERHLHKHLQHLHARPIKSIMPREITAIFTSLKAHPGRGVAPLPRPLVARTLAPTARPCTP